MRMTTVASTRTAAGLHFSRIGGIIVAAAYFPYDRLNFPLEEVVRLIDYCQRLRRPLLIGCDANAQAKANSWVTFCSETKQAEEASRLDKILSRNPVAILGSLKLPGGTFSSSDEQTLAHLVKSHIPSFQDVRKGASAEIIDSGRQLRAAHSS